MMLRRPCSASTGVRASGASTNSTPLAASSSRIFAVVDGSLVDVSITIEPGLRDRRDAVLAVDDFLDLRRAGHAQEDDVVAASEVGVGRHFLGTRGEQVLERLAVAVRAHRERKALGDEVLGDAVAHEAEADESDAGLSVHAFRCVRLLG